MIKKLRSTLAIALLVAATPALAEDVTLEDFAWLAGQWIEVRDDGTTIEVIWAPPIGPMLIGTWQLLRGDDLVAYETLRILETEAGFSYRSELYERDSNFETPLTNRVRLVSVEDAKAVFGGQFFGQGPEVVLTIEVTPAGELFSWAVIAGAAEGEKMIRYRAARTED